MKIRILAVALLVSGLGLIGFHFLQSRSGSMDDLDIKIYPAAYVMPSAYKVYENSQALNGRYFLFKSVLANNGSTTLKNVKVSYKLPNHIDWTEIKDIPAILPGQKVVVTCYPKFKPDIVDRKTSSKETGEIKILAGGLERKETFAFEMKGVNEFLYSAIPADEQASYSDVFDNMALLPCYVTPHDPIVKYYTANIQEKILKGETAGVTRDTKEAVRFLMGIYEATRRGGMVYSSTGGVPSKIGDVSSLLQNIRLPREVITGNTGLCIELSLLYASILSNAGLEPIIYLVPGHAYPGFRLNGQYYAIESTGIGGEGLGSILSAEQALTQGMKQLEEFFKAAQMGDERYQIVDIIELNKNGVVAMELKDDTYLRQRVDALTAKFELGAAPQLDNRMLVAGSNNMVGGNMTSGDLGGGTNNGGSSNNDFGTSNYSGVVNFSYPSDWSKMNRPVQGLSYLLAQMDSPDQTASASVFNFSGFSSVEQALYQAQQDFYNNFGVQVHYQVQGTSGNYYRVSGQSVSQNGTFNWTGLFKVTESGVAGVTAGAYSNYYNSNSATLNAILNSIR